MIKERSRTYGRGNDTSGSFWEMTYKEFLETKIELAKESGFVVDPEKVYNPHLHDVGGDFKKYYSVCGDLLLTRLI